MRVRRCCAFRSRDVGRRSSSSHRSRAVCGRMRAVGMRWQVQASADHAAHTGEASAVGSLVFRSSASGASPRRMDADTLDAWPTVSCGDFPLLEPLSRGGAGIVHKAFQASLKRLVALKRPGPAALSLLPRSPRLRWPPHKSAIFDGPTRGVASAQLGALVERRALSCPSSAGAAMTGRALRRCVRFSRETRSSRITRSGVKAQSR